MKEESEILVISHKYPPSIGGMQKHCFELVEGLSKKVKVHRLIQTAGGSKLRFFLTVVKKAKRILKANPSINLIYVNDGLMAFVLSRLMKHTQVPMVATIHGLDVVFPMNFYQKWVRTKLAKYNGIIAVSNATANECRNRGLSADKVFMVKNGFEPNSQEPKELESIREKLKSVYEFDPEGKKIILSIGRGVKRKGFSWFIRNVLTQLPEDVCYLIIGPKANTGQINFLQNILPKSIFNYLVLFAGLAVDELQIERAIRDLKLEQRVKRISGLSYGELNDLIQLADISVMPNLEVNGDFEGFGLVALEAVSNGTLCVASDVEGIATAIEHGKNGILLESANQRQWVDAITNFLEHPDDLKSLTEKFQKYTLEHSYSWDRMVNEYYDVFGEIVNKQPLDQ
ncbi:MAG: glycosyltransferase family 4 protein [Cyclobacteriaceae bacterium]